MAIREIHPLLLASVDAAAEIQVGGRVRVLHQTLIDQDNHNQTLAALVESREAASAMLEKLDRSLEVIQQTSGLTQEAMKQRRWSLLTPSLFSGESTALLSAFWSMC